MSSSVTTHQRLIRALQDPAVYPHPADRIEVIETHISTVVLAGEYAYKIKKPLDLGFLDFSTLAARRHYCEEELRLNRRLAPELYLAVVAFCGSPDAPRFDDAGPAFEYAVKMRRFDQDQLLDRLAARGALRPAVLAELPRRLADFHARAGRAATDTPFGRPDTVLAPMVENFSQLRDLDPGPERLQRLQTIEDWTLTRHAALSDTLSARREQGFVRECHGDMHLGNMALVDGELTIFDCIEFNDALRWIDVISELAFLGMDLDHRGLGGESSRLVSDYLELSGDYAGLTLLRFYQVYRAMVRAKVTGLRVAQGGLDATQAAELEAVVDAYLALATRYTRPPTGAILLTHGVSGSGKSTVAAALVESLGAVRLRSDVERKRLFGLSPLEPSGSARDAGIYTPDASDRTYLRLLELCETVCRAGFPAVVDATFLERSRRDPFRSLAARLGLPFLILNCTATAETLRARIGRRSHSGTDASEADLAVLTSQLERYRPPESDEPSLEVGTETSLPVARIRELIHSPGDP